MIDEDDETQEIPVVAEEPPSGDGAADPAATGSTAVAPGPTGEGDPEDSEDPGEQPTTPTPAGGATTATPTADSPLQQRSEQPVAEPQAEESEEAEEPADDSGSSAGTDTAPSSTASRARRIIDKAKPVGSSSTRRAGRIARKAVGRIVSDSSASTQPIPIIAALKGTPYQAPVESTAKSEDEARMILDLAVDIGAIMLRAGAGSADVEVSVIATCTSLGLLDAEVDLTSNSLTVHYANPDGSFMTVLRVNREESLHFAKLASVHALVSDMAEGRTDYLEARERIDAIRRQRRPYTEALVTLAWGILAGCFVLLLGGGYVASLLGFLMAVVNDRFGALLGRTGIPVFFTVAGQSMFTTLVAMAAWTFDLIAGPQFLVASGIVLLLPTVGLLSAVQDSLTRFPLTAASRTVEVLVTMAGIVSGIALGLRIGLLVGLSPIEIVVEPTGMAALSVVISLLAASAVSAAGAVGHQASRRIVVPAALVGLAGFGTMMAMSIAGFGNIITSLVSATVVGFLCRPIALRRSAPAIVMLLPAIFPLLQGLSIFSAVYEIIQPQEQVPLSAGLSSLFAAIIANAALAVGAIFGDVLARPLRSPRRSQPPVDPAPAV
mgnify:FL=1